MRNLFILIIIFSLTSCSIIKKNKEIKREKVEVSEIQKTDVQLETENSNLNISQKTEIADYLNLISALNFKYAGTANDSAEIEIIQTPNGIKIKTKGTAVADFKANSESKTNKTETKSETKSESAEKINLKVDSEKEVKSDKSKIDKSKDVKRFDFSAWWWIVILILAVIALALYWFFGRPKKS